ncbi:MAG: sodium ion-translocating decarboxylase subunit beta [Chloroflexi bacterium]|jgi:sodium ion-translocating decarboxylase beta subunit|nr:sodium ion-translocating decarboxylase subunit beta [Chloroflexota bacterium]
MDLSQLNELLVGFQGLTIQRLIMMIVGGVLIWLAIKYEYEPLLLLPIGLGAVLANIPGTGLLDEGGLLKVLYDAGIENELFPSLVFIGIGAMTDFGPLLENPKYMLFGAAAQFGIFGTLLLATLAGFNINQAASIGIIGAADGPTSIFVASELAPDLVGPITVAAYSYMSLVPIIQPPVMKLLTTREERRIRMPYTSRPVSKVTRIVFPIMVTVITGILVPKAVALIGMLMFGNLVREAGVVQRISNAAQNEIANIVTTFLGVTIGSTMVGEKFLNWQTMLIIGMGLLAFAMDTAAGVLFGKFMNYLSGGKINPLLGGCGISAFPMSARVVQKLGHDEDYSNFLLMHAMASNTSGQIASVLAGGVVLALLSTSV